MKICSVEDCKNKVRARSLCPKHYERWRKHGSPEHSAWNKSTEERFWEKVDRSDDHWGWSGAISDKGYARMYLTENRNMYQAHRYSYELVYGVLSSDMVVDHHYACPRHCVNPNHLRIASVKQNAENLTKLVSNNSSGYRGVYWNKGKGKWHVRVYHNGKCYFGGQFDDVDLAGECAKELRNSLFTHNDLDRVLD